MSIRILLVAGNGIRLLTAAGIEVTTDVLQTECEQVLDPYLKRTQTGKPWLIAKWAMTLDGKIATVSGDSRWISNQQSRSIVHQIRGRVDGIMVGIGTAIADDPMLNARPVGPRVAKRIIVDSTARIPLESKLVQTAKQFPTLIAVGPGAEQARVGELENSGCEVFQAAASNPGDRLGELLDFLGSSGLTNVLVEGGGQLLGSLHDLGQLDECHVFIGPKLLGGLGAPGPVGGMGVNLMQDSIPVEISQVEQLGMDIHVVGRVKRRQTIG